MEFEPRTWIPTTSILKCIDANKFDFIAWQVYADSNMYLYASSHPSTNEFYKHAHYVGQCHMYFLMFNSV